CAPQDERLTADRRSRLVSTAKAPSMPAAATSGATPSATGPWWLRPAMLFDGEKMRDGVMLRIENGRVAAIALAAEVLADPKSRDPAPCWGCDCIASPAFVDCQVNGGG